jgi:oligogalacturonide lyase
MAKGTVHPREDQWSEDAATGRRIRQVTRHPSIHHHPFFFVPPYDDAMHWLIFVSHRTGTPQLYAEERSSGNLIQLTERDDLAEWSFHPSHNGRFVLFVAGTKAVRLDLENLREHVLADFGRVEMREKGMVGAAMGTTTVSRDDKWWAVPVKSGKLSRFFLLHTETGTANLILERDTIGHPQFCPDDPGLIFYAGPLTDRLWLVNRDGSGNRRLWQREYKLQWITHESWLRGRRELAFVDWPHGMRAIRVDTGELRSITRFPAWHAHPDDTGSWFACDTNFPDRGIHRFSATESAEAELLCESKASSVGAHWAGPFPYNDGPREVYAPQHTHPHPRPSPDGSRVLYTSDASGFAQLYECMV